MKTGNVLAVAAAIFSSACQAMPFGKRELVMVTDVQDVYETVHVVTTVWVGVTPATAVPTPNHDVSAQAVSTPTFSFTVPGASATSAPAPVISSSLAISGQPAPTPKPTPKPSLEPAPAPVTSVAPAPSPSAASSGSSGSSGSVHTGDITHYVVDDGAAGSCGWDLIPTENIVALSTLDMNNPANPNANPLCGKMITISYGGKQAQAKVVDTCQGCASGSIDLSNGLFTDFAALGEGRLHGAQWWFSS